MNRKYLAAVRGRLERTYYASDAQKLYVRRLLNEAFAHHYVHGLRLDPNHLDRLLKTEASDAIEKLKTAKQNGWK